MLRCSICLALPVTMWPTSWTHSVRCENTTKAAHGEYQTKRIILGIYDAMQHAINSGVPYKPVVDLSSLVISSDESS